jgi:hypothetical protein
MSTNLNPAAWNWTQWKGAGRNVLSYTAGGISAAVALHLISSGQGGDIMTNINLIGDGVDKIATGIGGLIAIATPIYTVWKSAHASSPAMQATTLQQEVPKTIIITSPEIAAATPSPAIMSNITTKAVPK